MLPMLHIQCLSACKRNSKYNVHKKSWFCWVKSNYCMTVCSKTASVVYVLLETKRWQSASSSPSSATLKSAELYHLPPSLKGIQQIADIEEITQPFQYEGRREGEMEGIIPLEQDCCMSVFGKSTLLMPLWAFLWLQAGFLSLCTFWCTWQSGTFNAYLIIYWKSWC